jgi:CheY-like chemotaxis protein
MFGGAEHWVAFELPPRIVLRYAGEFDLCSGQAIVRAAAGRPIGRIEAEGDMARILLAEDDAATRDLVQRALGAEGHEVVVTQDGTEALEKLQAGAASFDVLVTDVQMPGLDGVALVEKAIAANAKLRIVMMSGFADELGRAAHLRSRISQIITKPFTLEQIRTAVKAALA